MQPLDTKTSSPAAHAPQQPGESVSYGAGVYNEIMHFLIEEAHLLDDGEFKAWLELLADDLQYTMPVRQTVSRKRGPGFNQGMIWLQEDKGSLSFKVQRLYGDSAWAEDPPSRTRRLVTNLRLHETAVPGEYLAQSYLLIHRNRGDSHQFDIFSGRRDDILRRTDAGWRVAKRTILADQAALGLANLAIFF
jgi:3-phenylpropionate/cinnamic acid dioxygenase small subunit